jgi:hypothetical protein
MRQTGILLLSMSVALLPVAAAATDAVSLPDLSKLNRRIAKEPPYKAKPLYGLYVFGPEAKTRVWAVLDKSKPDAAEYDILYFDRNADGDLTAAGERIEGKAEAGSTTFHIGEFTDQVAGQKHTGLTLRRDAGSNPMVMLHMKWCDKVDIRGGYAAKPGPYTEFATTPAAAPVMWPGADGPLGFQFWMVDPLPIGEAKDVRVFLGHQGCGRNTFCAVPDTFLPIKVPVLATLVYTDKNGKEQRARSELRERC